MPNCASSLSEAIDRGLPFPKTSPRDAAAGADRLLGCYPNGKPEDPKGYIAAVVAVLAEYPPEIARRICDPVTGVPRTCKFLPTVAEISDALEIAMVPLRRRWREAKQEREEAARRSAPRALPDAAAKARVAQKLKEFTGNLNPNPEPVPFNRDGTAPVGTAAGGAVAKVLADIARSKQEAAE